MRLLLVTLTSTLVAVALNLTAHALSTRIDIWPNAAKVQPPRRTHYISLLDEDLPF
ncbi:hypothetical protein [Spirosoma radiotolerans]|uniref:hypothetical protein n=1 Tax=Spirosoma radiotolerans TaxID=1379870 RepID=UPI000A4F7AC7|nr:hypothetical protein [Spirosoma radiotolerans]